MTEEQSRRYEETINETLQRCDAEELAVGFIRYRALRKLHPQKYAELHRRNLAGERFDAMVDELIA